MTTLVQNYRRLIDKHFAAVQTDTAMLYLDKVSLEKEARRFMEDFRVLEAAFIARLEALDEPASRGMRDGQRDQPMIAT